MIAHALGFPDELLVHLVTPYCWVNDQAVAIAGDAAILDFDSGELRPIRGLEGDPDRPGMPLLIGILPE